MAHPSSIFKPQAASDPVSQLMKKRLVLNSWKEIAKYMGRGVRTVQRWEKDLMLPVHRPAGRGRSAVLAFSDEIDLWMRSGSLRSLSSSTTVAHADIPEWEQLVANSETLLKTTHTLKTRMLELADLMQEATKRHKALLRKKVPPGLANDLVKSIDQLQARMEELSHLLKEAEIACGIQLHQPRRQKLTNEQEYGFLKQ